jgi:hypothetical protein
VKRLLAVTLCWGAVLVLTCIGCGSGGTTTTATPGLSNYSLGFDGIDDFVATVGVHVLDNFTIEAWVKPASVMANGMHRGIAGRGGSMVLGLDDAVDGQWFLTQCSPGCDSAVSPAGDLVTGAWQHLSAGYDGSSLTIYRNGAFVATMPKTGDTTDFTGFVIGTWVGNAAFQGLIDEVRFWDVARTQPQIAGDMGSILTGTEPGLVGYWRFEEGSGQQSDDVAVPDNDAQLGSTAGPDVDDPIWSPDGAPVS